METKHVLFNEKENKEIPLKVCKENFSKYQICDMDEVDGIVTKVIFFKEEVQ